MTLQTVFEQDRERLTSALSGADAVSAVRVLNSELDRILYTFNDREESARVREAAESMIRTAKAACSLLDSAGETRIYGRTEYGVAAPGKGKLPKGGILLLIIGLAAAAVTAVCALLSASSAQPAGLPPRWLLAGAPLLAAAALFFAGMLLRRGREAPKETLHAETRLDPSRIYTHLLSVILVMDKCLEEVRSADRREEREHAREQAAAADPAELELLSQLLEEAYDRRGEDEQADETISQISFYLHKKGVDVVDWTSDAVLPGGPAGSEAAGRSGWFDMMPAFRSGTIRPALIADGKLLKKGMASAGRG